MGTILWRHVTFHTVTSEIGFRPSAAPTLFQAVAKTLAAKAIPYIGGIDFFRFRGFTA
jgi:hypothetical protein